jgi:hypothetical protein
MSDDIFHPARKHEAGPGEWEVRSSRTDKWSVYLGGGKMMAYMVAHILNNPDKYPDLDKFGLNAYRSGEQWTFEHQDDIPPRKVQEEVMDAIHGVMGMKL